jgi:hypothetical protein
MSFFLCPDYAARPRGFDSLPSQDPNGGRCPHSFSVMRSKIKIRTSSRHNAQLALWRDEVRILIFDDPAENERGQHPQFSSAQLYSNRSNGQDLFQAFQIPKSEKGTVYLTGRELAHCARAMDARGISSIFEKKIMHRARAARPRGFDSLPSLDPDWGRCPISFSVMRSKIKIRTSSRHKAN